MGHCHDHRNTEEYSHLGAENKKTRLNYLQAGSLFWNFSIAGSFYGSNSFRFPKSINVDVGNNQN